MSGPYVVTDFRPNDVATYAMNLLYRDADKPHFANVVIKGGGDATSAARAVFETGETDFAWNLQLAPDVLDQMMAKGRGDPVTAFGSAVEYVFLNQTDPDPALNALRSTVEGGEHPILADIDVRHALSLAIDRPVLAEALYGPLGKPTCNIVPAPAQYVSTANDECLTQDVDRAKALLTEAGWVDTDGDGIRDKDGRKLSLLFTTTTSGVRQDTQGILKQWWQDIGAEVELRNVAGSVFFGGDAGNPDTRQKFFADIEMYTDNSKGTDQESFLAKWTCASIPSPSNQWQGSNVQRFCSPEYDALAEKLRETDGLEARTAVAREMNDILAQSFTMLPIVHRGNISGKAKSLDGPRMNNWDSELWNIADWSRVD
ncbi:peptide ABC transporter substrate-binding protein [Falsirhodobacter sp. alg1]|uniref:peptide ABC transporter substrate-binding protein n=1 Tax=Falsirhodobacter sp. alg1 TaxID=1472418 RepID=UPI000693E789|nr:peptide ABC transporter substrate-binding protein [Falsirhodobacter sp. alg1]